MAGFKSSAVRKRSLPWYVRPYRVTKTAFTASLLGCLAEWTVTSYIDTYRYSWPTHASHRHTFTRCDDKPFAAWQLASAHICLTSSYEWLSMNLSIQGCLSTPVFQQSSHLMGIASSDMLSQRCEVIVEHAIACVDILSAWMANMIIIITAHSESLSMAAAD